MSTNPKAKAGQGNKTSSAKPWVPVDPLPKPGKNAKPEESALYAVYLDVLVMKKKVEIIREEARTEAIVFSPQDIQTLKTAMKVARSIETLQKMLEETFKTVETLETVIGKQQSQFNELVGKIKRMNETEGWLKIERSDEGTVKDDSDE